LEGILPVDYMQRKETVTVDAPAVVVPDLKEGIKGNCKRR
jgi:hypothetical protein